MSETDHNRKMLMNIKKLVDETLEDEEKVDIRFNIEDYLDEETMKLKYKEYIDKLKE